MVVVSGTERVIGYFREFNAYLAERRSPYRAIVAFSGEHDFGEDRVTESSLNGFPGLEIPSRFKEDPNRFLICADKFHTDYDEPLDQRTPSADHRMKGAFLTVHLHRSGANVEVLHAGCSVLEPALAPPVQGKRRTGKRRA